MVNADILTRVFKIGSPGGVMGSAFALDYKGRQYLVTAKPVLPGFKDGDAVVIWHDGQPKGMPCRLVGHGEYGAAVTVLAAPQLLAHPKFLVDTSISLISEDAYLLGFPYGQVMPGASGISKEFPMPFVKKSVVSGVVRNNPQAPRILYVDGYGNPGFSGGPLVAMGGAGRTGDNDPGVKDPSRPVIVGVITSAPVMPTAVYDSSGVGFIQCVAIEHALPAIEANQIGQPLDQPFP